jgi:hypothetical protein
MKKMKIIGLEERQTDDIKTIRALAQLAAYLQELRKKSLPHHIVEAVNLDIEEINVSSESNSKLRKLIIQKQTRIIALVEKELKIVPRNYYRNQWIPMGMNLFGLPAGVAFAISIGKMGFLAIGLPVGIAIGYAIGSGLDKKAFEEGRQLDIEIKNG